jgi:hypothetical protein
MPEDTDIDYYEYLTIKCNKCGKLWCFYPHRVIVSPECSCGNTNSGNCLRDWPQDKFGDFTLVKREHWEIKLEIPGGLSFGL